MADPVNNTNTTPAAESNQAPAPAAPSSSSPEDSIIETLRYDPFQGKPQEGVGAQTSPGSAPPRSDVQAPQPQQAPEGAPGNVPAPSPTQPADGTGALLSAADRLTQAVDRLQPPQAPQGPQKPDELPSYLYDIPPQLVNALASEDAGQRTAALQHLVAGTARAVHSELAKVIAEVKTSIPQIFQQQIEAHTYRNEIRSDFYSRYPVLKNPHLEPVVASVTQQVLRDIVAAGGRPTWSPQLAQAIAEKVFSAVPGLVAQPQPPAPVAQPVQPPHMFTPGSRPAAGNSVEADIANTLFG